MLGIAEVPEQFKVGVYVTERSLDRKCLILELDKRFSC